jgi:hypothetical protein
MNREKTRSHDLAAYERYSAWCRIVGVKPADYEGWLKASARVPSHTWFGMQDAQRHAPIAGRPGFDKEAMYQAVWG